MEVERYKSFTNKFIVKHGMYKDVNITDFDCYDWYIQKVSNLHECWNIGRIYIADDVINLGNAEYTDEYKYLIEQP